MADDNVPVTGGSGNNVATYKATDNRHHQEIVLETQTSSGDPVKVNSNNPLPVTLTGSNIVGVTGNVEVTNDVGNPLPVNGTVDLATSTPACYVSAASINATTVKNGAGQLTSVTVSSINAAMRYLKIYDKGASVPAPASDTPKYIIPVPGDTAGSGAVVNFAKPLSFANGIGFVLVGGIAHTDTTQVAANEHTISVSYT